MASDITATVAAAAKSHSTSAEANTVMVPRGLETESIRETQSDNNANADTSSGRRDLKEVVAEVEQYVHNIRRSLNFEVDQDIGKTVVQVMDSETDEVIRQIPSEEFLEIAKALEKTKSLFLKTEV